METSGTILVGWQVFVIIHLALFVWVLTSISKKPHSTIDKMIWLLISFFIPILGSVAYFLSTLRNRVAKS
jgi:hypothetical protein